MILKNKTAGHQVICGQRARPFRTVEVPKGTDYDIEVWEEEKVSKKDSKKTKTREDDK